MGHRPRRWPRRGSRPLQTGARAVRGDVVAGSASTPCPLHLRAPRALAARSARACGSLPRLASPLAENRPRQEMTSRDIESGHLASRGPRGHLAAARKPANRRPSAAIKDEEGLLRVQGWGGLLRLDLLGRGLLPRRGPTPGERARDPPRPTGDAVDREARPVPDRPGFPWGCGAAADASLWGQGAAVDTSRGGRGVATAASLRDRVRPLPLSSGGRSAGRCRFGDGAQAAAASLGGQPFSVSIAAFR